MKIERDSKYDFNNNPLYRNAPTYPHSLPKTTLYTYLTLELAHIKSDNIICFYYINHRITLTLEFKKVKT